MRTALLIALLVSAHPLGAAPKASDAALPRVNPRPAAPVKARPAARPNTLPGVAGGPVERHRNRRWSFAVPKGWKGPLAAPGGVRYAAPGGRALIEITFHKKGKNLYRAPDRYRQIMRERGSVGDPHTTVPVRIAGRFGSRARYTSHLYGGEYEFGQTREEFFTEEILIPDRGGNYLIRYRARKAEFELHRGRYLAFLRTFRLIRKAPPPDPYYLERDHLIEDLYEEAVDMDPGRHIEQRIMLEERLAVGIEFGVPAGFGFQAMYSLNPKWSAGIYFPAAKLAIKDASMSVLALRTRWHYSTSSMDTGAFLWGDLGYLTAKFPSPAEGETVVESKKSVFFPAVGWGYQHLWDFVTVEGGLGATIPQTLRQKTSGPSGTNETTQKLIFSLYLSGSARF